MKMITTVCVLTRSRRDIGSVCQTGLWEFAREVVSSIPREINKWERAGSSCAAANTTVRPLWKQPFNLCGGLTKPGIMNDSYHNHTIYFTIYQHNWQDARGNNRISLWIPESLNLFAGDSFHQTLKYLNALKYWRWSKQTWSHFSL